MSSMTRTSAAAETRDWRNAAACRDRDPELFFPTAKSGPRYELQVNAAKAVCDGCSVVPQCLDVAMVDPGQPGVVGGLDEHERRAAHRHAEQLAEAQDEHQAEPGDHDEEAGDDEYADEEDEPEPGPTSLPGPRIGHAAAPNAPAATVSATAVDGDATGNGLDRRVAAALAAHLEQTVREMVDPAVVRGLVEATGPAAASRWETALAAVLLFEQGQRVAAVARWLGEPLSEVRAWRRRYDDDEPLIAGGPGVGLQQVPRPAHLVADAVVTPAATASTVRVAA